MIRHRSPISGIAAFLDQYIATAGYDNRVILWDAKTHISIACGFHDHLANQCRFSPDGQYLVSSSSDYSARLWSIPDMKLVAIFHEHRDDVEALAFHPSKKWIATTSRDHKVHIYDFDCNLIQELLGHTQDVLSVVWINEQEIITSSDDGTVKRWNVLKGIETETIDLGGVETDTISLTKDGTIFAGNDLGEIVIIKNKEQQKIKAHLSGIKCHCFNNDLNMLISLSYDRSALLWKWVDGALELIKTTSLPSIVWARSADFLGEDKIVFATFGSQYAIFDYKKDQWLTSHIEDTFGKNAVLAQNSHVYSIGDAGIFYKDNIPVRKLPSLCNFLLSIEDEIVTGGQTGELFSALSGEIIYQHHSPLNCGAVFFKNDQQHIIVGTYTGEGLVFKKNTKTFEFVTSIPMHDNAIKGLSASKENIFSVCATGDAAFHSIIDFKLNKYITDAHSEICNGCAWLEENQFVSVGRDLTLRITSLNSQEVIQTPHLHSIKCIAVSADKKFIATGGYRGLLCVYNLQNKSWQSKRLTVAGISNLTFDEVMNQFIASSYDGDFYYFSPYNNTLNITEQKEVRCEINAMTDREAMALPPFFYTSRSENTKELFNELQTMSREQLCLTAESKTHDYKIRFAAGQLLGLLGDPRIQVSSPIMIDIPEYDAIVGINENEVEGVIEKYKPIYLKKEWIEKETPQFKIKIRAFRIRKYLVTNEEYRSFLEETKYPELPTSWEFGMYPTNKGNYPVYTVSEQAAEEFAQWISKKTHRKFRLPTEQEWECAASGKEHFEFPWGNNYQPDHANTIEEKIYTSTPVGIFSKGNSPFGLSDVAGNVEEYTADNYFPYQGGQYIKDDLLLFENTYRVCRGGSFTRYLDLARTTRRHGRYNKPIYVMGFRLVENIY